MNEPSEPLIITGSFNGLMDRVARIDFFHVWLEGRKTIKRAKKLKIEPTMRMSEVQEITALKREDLELFTSDIPLIEVVEQGADPLLSFSEVYCLVKIFERMFDDGVYRPKCGLLNRKPEFSRRIRISHPSGGSGSF